MKCASCLNKIKNNYHGEYFMNNNFFCNKCISYLYKNSINSENIYKLTRWSYKSFEIFENDDKFYIIPNSDYIKYGFELLKSNRYKYLKGKLINDTNQNNFFLDYYINKYDLPIYFLL